MARIAISMPDFDITIDTHNNPEFILMMAEGDSDSAESLESIWTAGLAVTKPKSSNTEGL